ncbi:hypothetical protein C8Q76DRAFT_630331 [Earliella scabrosa]|nr:hypothetical protein C8Q76DRAFT_630331 [Earliella scabrosa]
MLNVFVQCIDQFLDALTECRGVIGGEFALLYILRDPGFVPARLEVFVGDAEFYSFLDLLDLSTELSRHTMILDVLPTTNTFASDRAVSHVAPILTTTSLFIWVYEADCISASSPIGRTWTTGLMNFVTQYSFGCAYPMLTLRRLALMSDLCVDSMEDKDFITMHRMHGREFDFALHPSVWPRYKHISHRSGNLDTFPCLRELFICPDQARFFGDSGSLVVFMDTFSESREVMRSRGVAPYGHGALWRLWSSRRCDRFCAVADELLHGALISAPMVIVPHPVLPECPSDRDDVGCDFPFSLFSREVRHISRSQSVPL